MGGLEDSGAELTAMALDIARLEIVVSFRKKFSFQDIFQLDFFFFQETRSNATVPVEFLPFP